MVDIDLAKLHNPEYAFFDEELQMWRLKENAPPDAVELYKKYKQFKDEERKTGLNVF
jgi:hypothetical protein